MKLVYADYAAATPIDNRVIKEVTEISVADFGNPSSTHSIGQKSAKVIREAKNTLANFINCNPEEIYFTSSGSESNNLALLGVAKAKKSRGNHIITTNIEHPSILNTCKALEKDGYKVTYLQVDKFGQVNLSDLSKAVTAETILVTMHYGNSEIGTLIDVTKVGKFCRNNSIYFHVDACQSAAYLPIDVVKMNIDLLTINGNKMYGPKGVALLYVRDGVEIFPIIYGGGQQKSLRSGTENVSGIAGLALAAEITKKEGYKQSEVITKLRDNLQLELGKISGVKINITKNRLPNHLSIRLENRTKADLVKEMDRLGIAVSSGSACSSSSIVDSHVLRAISLSSAQSQSTLRITLGRGTSQEDGDKIIEAITSINLTRKTRLSKSGYNLI